MYYTPEICVLVVDDNEDLANINGLLLDKLGYETTVCYSGSACLDLLDMIKVDVILMDIDMPGINGIETCERIREVNMGRIVGIIAYTGSSTSLERCKLLPKLFDDCLLKPAEVELLCSSINAVKDARSL